MRSKKNNVTKLLSNNNTIKKIKKYIRLKKYKSTKRTKSTKSKKDDIIIKSITPVLDIEEGKKIDYKIKNFNLKEMDKDDTQLSILKSLRSFSPKINQDLVSLKSIMPENILKCENLLETNIGSRCLPRKSMQVQNKLLKNLRSSKHLDCTQFIAPKQYNSNCWFNTMFVTFFFSDKGRKFFRYMRQLMITGKKVNGDLIPDDLADIFFIFNKIIEASYNQHGNSNFKLIENYNTNYFIENLYNILLQKNIVTFKKNQSGNPIEYYLAIIKYLNYNVINVLNIDIISNVEFNNISKRISNSNIPEIIIIDIIDTDSIKITNRPIEFTITKNGKPYKYRLDSAIVRDTSQQHFCSLLTCNNHQYSFDGASFSRLSKYSWQENLNKPIKWGFEGHPLKWSFMNTYQMLFYYQI